MSTVESCLQYATCVPHELRYNGDFEDSIMEAVLNNNAKHDGLRVLYEDSEEMAQDGISIQASDIDQSTLPTVHEDELPLSLADARRAFTSAVPGVKLTHPGGFLEGGPGLDPEEDTFARDFLSNSGGIANAQDLEHTKQEAIEQNLALLRQRMQDRQRAKEQNEQIEKEIRALVDQHSMETKIHTRLFEEQKAKKEARERKKREKEGG